MGAECPNGHGRQGIVQNITVDGRSPETGTDIVARKLACGCVLATGDYEEFQAAIVAVRMRCTNSIRQAEARSRQQVGVLCAEYTKIKEEEYAE